MNIRQRFIHYLLDTSIGDTSINVQDIAQLLISEGIQKDHAVRIAMKIAQGK